MKATIQTDDGELDLTVFMNNCYLNDNEKYFVYLGGFLVGYGKDLEAALINAAKLINTYHITE